MNVVFDFAGVVFHWSPAALLRETLPARARDDAATQALLSHLFQGFAPGSDWAAFDLGLIEPDALAERIARRTGLAEAELHAVIDAIPRHLAAHAPTVELMHELKRAGHRLFYLSNMPAPYAEHLERSHDFLALFDDGVFSARVQMMKPQPEIFHAASRRFGLAPAQLVFIDDVAHNVEAARALGWQALHFTGADDCAEALRALAGDVAHP
jgi:putative hydrolase of the HAD superfamily